MTREERKKWLRESIAMRVSELAELTEDERESFGQERNPAVVVSAVMGVLNMLCPSHVVG